ncbi:hypothetical protein CYMTET_21288 [Cymbomonas tetramitiformis]|uniref:J domain-containing protein n=1 Tax=Cymbomonas tetramitiformis TaxID=36881 RepID=A0AAE0G2T9_9CHLO|nr:hypothetical protein CYMTET_21288 [Cymbomonas tetramitiformis]
MNSEDDAPAAPPKEAMAKAITEWTGKTAAPKAQQDVEFSDIFSVRRPKNVWAGTSSGVQSILKGVAAGTASLVAAPTAMAYQEGFGGFVKGLGAGIAGAVVLPIVGCTVGAVQIGRGLWNTPEAITETFSGKRWDQRQRAWVVDNLVEDGVKLAEKDDEDIFAAARQRAQVEEKAESSQAVGEPRETGFYEVLDIKPDATQAEIKRAYYLLARQLHPDKNKDDPTAAARFQELGEAYQVLSNEELRKKYDTHGKEGLGDEPIIDATAFFAMLFGSEQFDHLVGRLSLAAMAAAGAELRREELQSLQERRECRLAIKLSALLTCYTEGDVEGFDVLMQKQAAVLANASFGSVMLHTVGYIYENAADQYIGSISNFSFSNMSAFGTSQFASIAEKGHGIKTRINAIGSAINVYKASRKVTEAMKEGESKEAMAQQVLQSKDVLPAFVDALWSATVIDIEGTLHNVCQKVLFDRSTADKKSSLVRAQGLKRLGQIFQSVKAPESASADNLLCLMEIWWVLSEIILKLRSWCI